MMFVLLFSFLLIADESPFGNIEERMNLLSQKLELSSDQKEMVVPIIKQGTKERLLILREAGIKPGEKPGLWTLLKIRGKISESRSKTEKELSEILTESQMDSYLEITAKFREKMREKWRK